MPGWQRRRRGYGREHATELSIIATHFVETDEQERDGRKEKDALSSVR